LAGRATAPTAQPLKFYSQLRGRRAVRGRAQGHHRAGRFCPQAERLPPSPSRCPPWRCA